MRMTTAVNPCICASQLCPTRTGLQLEAGDTRPIIKAKAWNTNTPFGTCSLRLSRMNSSIYYLRISACEHFATLWHAPKAPKAQHVAASYDPSVKQLCGQVLSVKHAFLLSEGCFERNCRGPAELANLKRPPLHACPLTNHPASETRGLQLLVHLIDGVTPAIVSHARP